MRNGWLVAGALAALLVTSAQGRPLPQTGNPATLQSLLACRAITDSGQRLACYDKATGDFAAAVGKKEVVVIDKARANEAKKSLFGFSVPNFAGLFGGGDEVNQIEGTVEGAHINGDGGWTIRLNDGSVWAQTDDTPVALEPRHGDKVVVRRGTLGSYFVKLGSQPGFKAKRVG
jgi:hypothetical protein